MHVYCINLDRRPDRRAKVQAEFNREELNTVEFFKATDGCSHPKMNRGECGCTDSHIRVWKDIVVKGYPYALVFEDDSRLVDNFRECLDEIIQDLPTGWDYVNLGPVWPWTLFRQNISQRLVQGSSTTTHCYLVSQKGALHLSQWNTSDVHFIVDMQIARTPLNSFYSRKPLATQNVRGVPLLGFFYSVFDGDLGIIRHSFDFDFGLRVHFFPIIFFVMIFICIRIQRFGLRF